MYFSRHCYICSSRTNLSLVPWPLKQQWSGFETKSAISYKLVGLTLAGHSCIKPHKVNFLFLVSSVDQVSLALCNLTVQSDVVWCNPIQQSDVIWWNRIQHETTRSVYIPASVASPSRHLQSKGSVEKWDNRFFFFLITPKGQRSMKHFHCQAIYHS